MGMFDFIRCEAKLPELEDAKDITFQTKDLDCLLEDYTITKNGRLINKDGHDIDYCGNLRFYEDVNGKWYEYDAVFENGSIVSITNKSGD